jgi:hypothetical protein
VNCGEMSSTTVLNEKNFACSKKFLLA